MGSFLPGLILFFRWGEMAENTGSGNRWWNEEPSGGTTEQGLG